MGPLIPGGFAQETSGDKPKIGLVLSGGGAKGAAHIAVLKALEELEIEIDYIGGTSMGSFIGFLYAAGYDADRIKEIFFKEDWQKIFFNDKIPRRSLSMEEKKYDGRYIRAFPIRNWQIELPSGLESGQSLSSLIARLTWPVNHVADFKLLPTPFLCLATDLETGEAVVLDRGFLPDAIRASMAFPSVVAPIEIDGRLLVDGGLVRNLPVSDVIAMGADIIIAVDVSARLYEKKELNSVLNILEQIASYEGSASTARQRNLSNILIQPDIEGYTADSFSALDTLYARGSQAVGKVYSRLKALSDSLKMFTSNNVKSIPLSEFRAIYIEKIKIEGLNKVSPAELLGNLRLKPNSWITPHELENAIERTFGTQYFKHVNYKLEQIEGGVNLIIRVEEEPDNFFNIGLHYDSDMKSSVLLNTTVRNKLGAGSRLSLDSKLSENPTMIFSYFIHTNFKPQLGFGFEILYNNFDVPIRNYEDGKLINVFDYSIYAAEIKIQTIFSNRSTLGFAIQRSISSVKPIYGPDTDNFKPDIYNFYSFLNFDTFDRAFFPRRGHQGYAEKGTITDKYTEPKEKQRGSADRYLFSISNYFQIHPRISLFLNFHGGKIKADTSPSDYLFWIGGPIQYEKTLIPFVGLRFMEFSTKEFNIIQMGCQIEPLKNKFLNIRYNWGKARPLNNQTGLALDEMSIRGIGISLGMLSPIGPIEYSLLKEGKKGNYLTHFSIGYWF